MTSDNLAEIMAEIEQHPGTEPLTRGQLRAGFGALRDAAERPVQRPEPQMSDKQIPVGVLPDGSIVWMTIYRSDDELAELASLAAQAKTDEFWGDLATAMDDGTEVQADFYKRALVAIPNLIAEVRRLRRENQLLKLSQGDLGAVGAD